MSKAKTASKNDPTTRVKVKDVFYNGKKVKPTKFYGEKATYVAAEYEDGSMAIDINGNPMPWADVVAADSAA
ncbi:hypothetical protein [Rickettsiales endosymbiont of Stachyamoeba lipophora]|uniref:hypothetical protein n=1 Tax=Rickettsiales endosymbiont of Stachyamoeba lipophora TaxID=2486578 RepID=UPI000F648817|nr:hypothetical protein [Rickettsiales endosymbiont of Stachyamoeba lipophora]AZL15653.1 hypothetical protein EF513_03700 [Rickettsiales endosymbiont of Stachyamoeba lipophora]